MSVISASGSNYSSAPPQPAPNVGDSYRPSVYGVNVLGYGARGDGTTDDTAAISAAISAASARAGVGGLVDVIFPPGYGFLLHRFGIRPGVRLWAYGATIIPTGNAITSGLMGPSVITIPRFEIRGGTWQGTGAETIPLYQNTTADIMSDIRFQDMYINNWGCGPLYVANVQRAQALNNTILNSGSNGGLNAINFVFGAAGSAVQQMIVKGNTVLNTFAAGIAIVQTNATAPAGFEIQGIITDNITDGLGGTLAGSIDIEADSSDAQAYGRLVIANNHCTNRDPSGLAFGMTVEVEYADVVVANNTIEVISSGGYAIWASGSRVSVVNNRLNANTPFYPTNDNEVLRSGNILSSGKSQGRATLVAGTVTVNTAEIQANDNVLLTVVSPNGTRGEIQLGTITPGTSFVINSIQPGTASTVQTLDTSTIYWRIDH